MAVMLADIARKNIGQLNIEILSKIGIDIQSTWYTKSPPVINETTYVAMLDNATNKILSGRCINPTLASAPKPSARDLV